MKKILILIPYMIFAGETPNDINVDYQYTEANYPNPYEIQQNRIGFPPRFAYDEWIYRARIDSVEILADQNKYPNFWVTYDSCFYGSAEYVGRSEKFERISGDRKLKYYPLGYWEAWKGKAILASAWRDPFILGSIVRNPPYPVNYQTNFNDYDDVWYFSSADTVWNDWVKYGKPFPLQPIIDSLRADSIRLANTPVLSIPTVTAEPVELWSLSGENLWSGRDWRKSGLPTGVYLLKNRDVQRVVWVE